MFSYDIPNRPVRMICQLGHNDGVFFVTYRPRRRPGSFREGFLVICSLIFWTLFCLGISYKLIETNDSIYLFFTILFWVGWLAKLAMAANFFFGVERLAVAKDGIGYERKVLLRLASQFLPSEDLVKIKSVVASTNIYGGDKIFAVEIIAREQILIFAQGVPNTECLWIAHEIREAISFE